MTLLPNLGCLALALLSLGASPATATAPADCDGCVDMSGDLISDGDLAWTDTSGATKTYMNAICVTVRHSGICSIQAHDPPWSHILECKQAIPCTPRVTFGLMVGFFDAQNHADGARVIINNGQYCTGSFIYNHRISVTGSPYGIALFTPFDQRVDVPCGMMDCLFEADAEVRLEGLQYEAANGACIGPCWPVKTMRIAGTLACTPCSMQQQTAGAGGD